SATPSDLVKTDKTASVFYPHFPPILYFISQTVKLLLMNAVLEKDLACTTDLLQQVKDFSAAFLSGINERPVKSRATAFPPLALPAAAAGAAAALQQFMERYEAHLAANAGARYWGFVTGGATPAAL